MNSRRCALTSPVENRGEIRRNRPRAAMRLVGDRQGRTLEPALTSNALAICGEDW